METAVITASKAAPSAKEWISINIFNSDQHEKTNKSAGNIQMFHFDINMKRLEIHFKNDSFQWFRVNSFFWETITLNTVHFQISNFAGLFIHSAVLHTAWMVIFSKIHNRATLIK